MGLTALAGILMSPRHLPQLALESSHNFALIRVLYLEHLHAHYLGINFCKYE